MSNKYLLLIALCLPVAYQAVYGQKRTLSLNEVFQLAEQNNKQISSNRIGIVESEQQYKDARAQRLPDVSVSASLSYLGDGLITNRDYSHPQRVHIPHFGNDYALMISQVLFSGGAITAQINLSNLECRMAELEKQKNQQKIRFLLSGYYLDILKLTNEQRVLDSNIALTEKLLENIRKCHSEGTALSNDITRYELQLANLRLQKERVVNSRSILNHAMATSIGLEPTVEIVPDTSLAQVAMEMTPEKEWQERAANHSPGVRQAETLIQMSKQQVKVDRADYLPKVSVVAEDHLNGPVTIEIPALNNNFNYWFVGVGVKYNISSLFKNNHKLQRSKLAVEQNNEEKDLALQETSNAVQEAFVRMKEAGVNLKTQEKSVQLALQNYAVIEQRYHNDLAMLTDMLDASNARLNAELDLVNARIDLVYRFLSLKYACGEL